MLIRWICENCGCINETPDDFYKERADEGAPYADTCEVCARGVWDVREQPQLDQENGHHLWCNYPMGPVEDCKMCRRLWKEYPYKPGEEGDMVVRYFHDAELGLRPGKKTE
jgi:hypothetical protein